MNARARAMGRRAAWALGCALALLACDPLPAPVCVAGSTRACSCDAAAGITTCGADGLPGVCSCAPAEPPCVPGRSVACTCADGSPSARRCDASGAFEPCACAPSDAGAGDAELDAPDAGPVICDPYAGASCGCGETPPPASPTILPAPPAALLGTGPETLVDVLVHERGVFIVLRDEVRLLSRTAGLLAQWPSEREILAAALVGNALVVADRAVITWLDEDLGELGHFSTAEPCTTLLPLSCDRILCAVPLMEWSRRVYDLATGAELFHDSRAQGEGTPAAAIPGVDAFLTGPYGYSPSHFWYQRVHDDGSLELIGEGPYAPDYYASSIFGFIGWPATHLVTQNGQLLRLDGCAAALPGAFGTCLQSASSLHLFGSDEILAMSGGADGQLSVIRAPFRDYIYDPPCITGCRLQRVDALEASASTARPLTLHGAGHEVRLRHDAFSGRAVIATPRACGVEYPFECDGWEVQIATY